MKKTLLLFITLSLTILLLFACSKSVKSNDGAKETVNQSTTAIGDESRDLNENNNISQSGNSENITNNTTNNNNSDSTNQNNSNTSNNGNSNIDDNNTSSDSDADSTSKPSEQEPTYTLKTYSFTDDYGNAGTYTKVNTKYKENDIVELEATVQQGYNFEGWFIDDYCVSEDLKYSFSMKSSNINIEARYNYFTVNTYSYSDEYENAGTYTKLDHQKVSKGETVTLIATENNGYTFEGWFIDDICVNKNLAYSFVMKGENISLEARWNYYIVSTYSYTDEEGMAGTFTKKENEKTRVGDTVSLTATVKDGYNFEGWFVNDICVSTDLEYSFTMKADYVIVEARYSYYVLNVECYSDDEGLAGTYPKINDKKVSNGETVILTATVEDGYNFEGWFINDVCVCSDLTYEFVMGKFDKNIRAEYSYYTFTVNAYLDRGWLDYFESNMGSYTKYDAEKISAGRTITLKATLADGYTFKGWYIGKNCVSTNLEYSYTMTKNDVEINPIFTYYTVTTDAYLDRGWIDYFESNMGSYTQYSEQKIRVGETVTLVATSKAGYTFVGWEHRGTIVSTSSTYRFVMPSNDEEYIAVFKPIN